METRRVQKIGGGSYSFILPKDWAQKNHISRDVAVTEHTDGALVIYSPAHTNRFSKSIKITGKSRVEIMNEIINLYELGADMIDIVGVPDARERRSIQEALNFIIGFQLVAEQPNKIVLKSVLSSKGLSLFQCLQSMAVDTRAMIEDAVEAFLIRNRKLAEDVIRRDTEVDRLYHLAVRIHQSVLQDKLSDDIARLSPIETNAFEYLAAQIERLADRAVLIANLTVSTKYTAVPTEMGAAITTLVEKIQNILLKSTQTKLLEKKQLITLFKEKEAIKKEWDVLHLKAIHLSHSEAVAFLGGLDRIIGGLQNILEKQYQRMLIAEMTPADL
jgi:phosphate uptake regulator